MDDSVRIDKWLWAVRIFKTRSDAAEACRTNRVTLNGSYTKPSREIKPGDTVTVRKTLVTYSFRVLALVSSRQGAKNVPEYMEDITPPEELNKLNVPRETIFVQRDRGMGRPTKRERREIDALIGRSLLFGRRGVIPATQRTVPPSYKNSIRERESVAVSLFIYLYL